MLEQLLLLLSLLAVKTLLTMTAYHRVGQKASYPICPEIISSTCGGPCIHSVSLQPFVRLKLKGRQLIHQRIEKTGCTKA